MNIIITKASSQQIQPIVKVLVENGNQVTRVVRHIKNSTYSYSNRFTS
ncbi:MAG: hypothetical protein MUF77_11140 [Leptospira sp.]|nr:hypothetical protein [Leptospira sp.]